VLARRRGIRVEAPHDGDATRNGPEETVRQPQSAVSLLSPPAMAGTGTARSIPGGSLCDQFVGAERFGPIEAARRHRDKGWLSDRSGGHGLSAMSFPKMEPAIRVISAGVPLVEQLRREPAKRPSSICRQKMARLRIARQTPGEVDYSVALSSVVKPLRGSTPFTAPHHLRR